MLGFGPVGAAPLSTLTEFWASQSESVVAGDTDVAAISFAPIPVNESVTAQDAYSATLIAVASQSEVTGAQDESAATLLVAVTQQEASGAIATQSANLTIPVSSTNSAHATEVVNASLKDRPGLATLSDRLVSQPTTEHSATATITDI